MPFGMASAPLTWTKGMRQVVGHLPSRDFRIIAYVDDFDGAPPASLGHPETVAQAADAYLFVERLLGELGLKLHPTKEVSHGPTRMRLLEHIIDSVLPRFLLPVDRVDVLVIKLTALFHRENRNRRWAKYSAIHHCCGAAVSTSLPVPTIRYHFRSLYTALQYMRSHS